MTNEDFINYLVTQANKTIIFTLEGIVSLKIQIEKINIKYNEDYIEIENGQNNNSYIKLNLHQLMKISKEESSLVLEFDQLQKVIITIKEEVS